MFTFLLASSNHLAGWKLGSPPHKTGSVAAAEGGLHRPDTFREERTGRETRGYREGGSGSGEPKE